jgi:hypothetical protein
LQTAPRGFAITWKAEGFDEDPPESDKLDDFSAIFSAIHGVPPYD